LGGLVDGVGGDAGYDSVDRSVAEIVEGIERDDYRLTDLDKADVPGRDGYRRLDLTADWMIVMRAGKVVEAGETEAIMSNPSDAYSRTLLATTPMAPEIPPNHAA
jgi:ABC-type phosphonate transport system ATPase subunit